MNIQPTYSDRPSQLLPWAEIIERLTRLRQSIETDEAQLDEVMVPMVFVLSDVCDVLGLDASERASVLGADGTQYLEQWNQQAIHLRQPVHGFAKHSRPNRR